MNEPTDKDEQFVAEELNSAPEQPVVPDHNADVQEEEEAEDLVLRAEAAAERMEAANAAMEKNIERQEALKVQRTLGGRAEAGGPGMTEDEKKDARAKKFLEGKKTWATDDGIYRRRGSKKNPIVEKIHTLTPRAKIKPMLGFKTTVHKFVRRNFPKFHAEAMAHALETARKK